jgi:hypothetical protein
MFGLFTIECALSLSMSDFYFFTEVGLLNSQPSSNAFGSKSATKYLVGSLHAASASSKAYAVYDGILVAQDPPIGKPFHFFVGIEGIGIGIRIPGTASEKEAALILKGYLAIKNPDDAQGSDGGKEYVGAVSFAMPWRPTEWPLSHAYDTHTKKLQKLNTASACFSLGLRCSSLQFIEVINKVNYRL